MKTKVKTLGLRVLLLCLLLISWTFLVQAEQVKDYYHIVVLSDSHLPFKPSEIKTEAKQEKVLQAKTAVREHINSWEDVDEIVVTGDIVGEHGTIDEYEYARDYFAGFNKPVYPIVGNHDFVYTDEPNADGKFKATPEIKCEKLDRFKSYFNLESVYYSQKVGKYLLVFLSPDDVYSKYLTTVSSSQLDWLQATLSENRNIPTIILFHAPLAGTLYNYNKNVNTNNFIAQPRDRIKEIIKQNPQVFLWVSGHTHTPPTNDSYKADINLYENQVTNIHNCNMDRETIYTNSLYLYSDKVVVRTYNHRQQAWMDDFDRVFSLPEKK
jgi:predicted phosphodiesterase